MRKSRPVRIAVNLCVIGALLTYAGVWIYPAAGCDASVASVAKCRGCGHCTVSEPGERCTCCCQQAKPRIQSSVSKKSCCHRPADLDVAQGNSPESTHQICNCGHRTEPAVPVPAGQFSMDRLVQLLLAGPTSKVVVALNDGTLDWSEREGAASSLLPRDSQRRLCVWLI